IPTMTHRVPSRPNEMESKKQPGHPLPQVVWNKISSHPNSLPTKIVKHKTKASDRPSSAESGGVRQIDRSA
ncbi:hypothetical protein ACFWXJ_24510, partial [[Kitasatospora] papulosa]